VDVREESSMFTLVIKEKTGVVGGWLEVDGEEHVLPFGEYQDDAERAIEAQALWSDWMDKEVDTVQDLDNGHGKGLALKPCLIESIAVVYTRS
jgi:hypothetical protein